MIPYTQNIYFNSIKVRLELKSRIDLQDSMRFQFHKGTIRTNFGQLLPIFCEISIP